MTGVHLLLLVVGGALGAVLRFWITEAWAKRNPRFPYGTLFVNLFGSALLGGLIGVLDPEVTVLTDAPVFLFGGVGFCGAFTTFSSFCTETVGMLTDSVGRAVLYICCTISGSLSAFVIPFLMLS